MSNRATLVAVVLALLGVAAVVIVRKGMAPAAPAATVLAAAANLPVDRVDHITLQRPGQPDLAFERRGDAWTQVAPFDQPMERYSMRQLALDAAQVAVQRKLDAGEVDRHDLELEGPGRATLRLGWGDGEAALTFGRRGVAGRWYVATPSDGSVYIAAGDLYDRAVEMDPREWRDRALLPLDLADAEAIDIEQGPQPIRLKREGHAWMMLEPYAARADDVARTALLSDLGRAKHGGFIADQPDDLAPFGLAEPAARVSVRCAAPGARRVRSRARCGCWWATACRSRARTASA